MIKRNNHKFLDYEKRKSNIERKYEILKQC